MRILCAIYSFQFISIQFISILFYSIQRDEKNETLRKKRKKRKISKNIENYEILRKKGNTLIKNHVSVIFYVKTVYFFIHAKNVFITFFLFFVRFPFFRSFSFFSLISFCSLFAPLAVVAFFPFFRCFSPVFCSAARARVFACFYVFMQNKFCIFCWIAPYSVSRLKFQLYFSESMLY